MTIYTQIFKHLLPRALAWRITFEKTLKSFFKGLEIVPSSFRDFIDLIWADLFPQTTRQLDAWEEEFGLLDVGLTDQERRDRLDGRWGSTGRSKLADGSDVEGQSPRYFQDRLHAAGFTDLFVHDMWSAVVAGVPTVRDPRDYENAGGYGIDNITTPGIYSPPAASADPNTWPFWWYIGPEVINLPPTIDQRVDIPKSRRRELESLVLQMGPGHLWVMMFINYTTTDRFKFAISDAPVYSTAHGFGDDAKTTGGKFEDR